MLRKKKAHKVHGTVIELTAFRKPVKTCEYIDIVTNIVDIVNICELHSEYLKLNLRQSRCLGWIAR